MQQWLILFPKPLLFLTIFVVILPTFLAIFFRLKLYEYLLNSTQKVQYLIQAGASQAKSGRDYRTLQPKIVENLEARFDEANIYLEQVNTSALIDNLYSQEKLNFWGLKIGCELIEYCCRILPNLLLSFGLIGTFFGITSNLYYLSQIINQVDITKVNQLVEDIQKPLQGMGIAFITSLIAIFCSSLLTIINSRWNTNIAKYQFISALEDYLDNICFPAIRPHSRIDKAVDSLEHKFDSFLTSFRSTVRDAIKESLGEQIKEIVNVNKESARLAEQVYSGLLNASSSLDSGARKFEEAANTIENSDFADKLAATTTNLDITYKNFAQSTSFLQESTQLIKNSLEAFKVSVDEMIGLGEDIKKLNTKCNEILEVNHKQIAAEKTMLSDIKSELANFTNGLNNYQQQIQSDLQKLGESLVTHITQEIRKNNQQVEQMSQTVQSDFQKLGESLVTNVTQEIGKNNQQVEKISQTVNGYISNLNQIQSELNRLVITLQGYEGNLNTQLHNLGDRLISTVDKNASNSNRHLSNLEQLNAYLGKLQETQLSTNKLLENLTKFNSGNSDNHNSTRNMRNLFRKPSTNEPTIRRFQDPPE
ncbi:MAG: methyl-accepting chemotaxis protein [Crocosphaera sp.]|nr:methyl-accepting chemotaxis protein [Crocosphaera sp.]